jgi:dTDP-glucose pyrophosphorylase
MDPNLVILAGGISSRMKKAGSVHLDPQLLRDADEKSKSMIGLGQGGRPFLDYLLINANAAGYRDIVIVVGEGDRSVRGHYGSAERGNVFLDMMISYAFQAVPAGRMKPLGTADALLCALMKRSEWAGKNFTVCNGDNLYSKEVLRFLLESTDECALIDYDRDALAFDPDRVQQFAVVSKDDEGYLRAILEKPSPDEIAQATGSEGRVGVSMNIFRLSYDVIIPYLKRVPLHRDRKEKELPIAVMMLAQDFPRMVRAYPRAEHVPDLTDKHDIKEVQEYVRTTFGEREQDSR